MRKAFNVSISPLPHPSQAANLQCTASVEPSDKAYTDAAKEQNALPIQELQSGLNTRQDEFVV